MKTQKSFQYKIPFKKCGDSFSSFYTAQTRNRTLTKGIDLSSPSAMQSDGRRFLLPNIGSRKIVDVNQESAFAGGNRQDDLCDQQDQGI